MKKRIPLSEIIRGFDFKYGQANRKAFHSKYEFQNFVANAILQLIKMVRKQEKIDREFLIALGSVFSRTVGLVNWYCGLDVVQALSQKYPVQGCAYCKNNICICDPHNRQDIQGFEVNENQLLWSIDDWCRHLKKIYGKTNQEKGLEFVLSRLLEEFYEIADCEFRLKGKHISTVAEFRNQIAKEFADVFAWIFAIANILNLNLDGLAKAWAFKKCATCKKNPCFCGPF